MSKLRFALSGAACLMALGLSSAIEAQQAASTQATPAADLGGIWQLSGSTKGFPQSEWSATTLPFNAEGQKAFNANHPGKGPRLVPAARGNDPIGAANPFGIYRTLIYPRPVEIIQLKDEVVQLFEVNRVWRSIRTDGRPVPNDVVEGPFWYGYSVGHWEGPVLVVNTLSVDERAWLDEWGTPFSGNAKFEERWQRTGPDQIQMTLTVTDPTYYSRPWTSSPQTFRRVKKGIEPIEIVFAPMDEAAFNADIRDPAGRPAK